MSLFGGAASQARSRNLVEFKAGKMSLRGNMVYPDKRKGLVYLYQGNDLLMHLCWKDRSNANNVPEDDLVIFPDEIEFKKVTINTTGRVYILKWRSNARKLFFWMQEPKDEKDEEWCKKINDFLNHPPTPGFADESSGNGSAGSGAHPLQPLMDRMTGGGAGGIDANDLSNVLRGMNPNDLASLISSFGSGGGGGGGGAGLMQGSHRSGAPSGSTSQQATTPSLLDTFGQQTADSRPNTAPAGTRGAAIAPATGNRSGGPSSKPRSSGTSASSSATVPTSGASSASASGSKAGPIQMSALESILANLGSSGTPTTGGATAAAATKPAIDLYDIMNSENLIPLLSNKDVQEKLRAHLPDGNAVPSTEKELRESIQSPQFRQAVGAFSAALQTGQLGPVLAQFGLPEEATTAADNGDLQAFAQALEKHYKKSNDDESNEKKPSDTTMDTN